MGDIITHESATLIEVVTKELVIDYVNSFLTNQLNKNEIMQFVNIATAFNLNPFKREIYCIAYGEGARRKLSILTGYEVYLKRAERTGSLDGWRCWTEGAQKDGTLKACIKIARKDRKKIFYHEVYFTEYTQGNSIWNSKPITMIKKVAMAQGFRLAFPDDLGGMPYTADELPDEMTKPRDVTPKASQKQAELVLEGTETEVLTKAYEEFIAVVDAIDAEFEPEDGANVQRTIELFAESKISSAKLVNITHWLKQKYAGVLTTQENK